MPIITFWSNNEKSLGQTVSTSVVATVTAIEHNYKVLLISADLNDKVLETCFGAQESNKEIVKGIVKNNQMALDSGIQGLLKLVDTNRITPELIHDYTRIIFKNRLEVLYSPTVLEGEREEKNILSKMKNIIINAARYYDYVFVDLKKGMRYNEQLEILDLSDVIVANIEQKAEVIENILNKEELKRMQRKIVLNICRNDKRSKYNSKNLARKLLKKREICEIDYNTLIFDAAQEGGIPELLLRFRTLRGEDENSEFTAKVKTLIEAILIKYREMRSGM